MLRIIQICIVFGDRSHAECTLPPFGIVYNELYLQGRPTNYPSGGRGGGGGGCRNWKFTQTRIQVRNKMRLDISAASACDTFLSTVFLSRNPFGGFIKGIPRGVRCTKSLRVLFKSTAPPPGPLLYCTQEQYSSLMNPPIAWCVVVFFEVIRR